MYNCERKRYLNRTYLQIHTERRRAGLKYLGMARKRFETVFQVGHRQCRVARIRELSDNGGLFAVKNELLGTPTTVRQLGMMFSEKKHDLFALFACDFPFALTELF